MTLGARKDRAAPVAPGQEVELRIDDLGHAGEGVGRYSNFTLFVPGAVPGDLARVRVTAVKNNHGRADLVAVVAPSEQRAAPACPVFAACGGCSLQMMDYAAQLRWKTARVAAQLQRLAGLQDVTVHPCRGMDDPWYYRGKAQFPVGLVAGRLITGPYAAGSHTIVPAAECLIQHPTANRVLAACSQAADRLGLSPYDEQAHTGDLRHVLVRVSAATGEALVVLVTRSPRLPRGRALARELMQAVPEVVGVVQNINPERTNVVLGAETRTLAGRDYVEERLDGLTFTVSALSFFQVNPVQAAVVYRQVLTYAQLTGTETAVDVYCGTGTMALFLARGARRVVGIEAVAAAVDDACQSAARNAIDNVTFYHGAAEQVLPELAAHGLTADVVVLDPPRRGADPSVLAAVSNLGPRRLIYVSCNPATLARDLALLGAGGYRAVEVQPVDMFPHTAHVEAVALVLPAGQKTG